MTQQVVIEEINRLRDRVATLEAALRRIRDNVGFGDYYACACIAEPNKGHMTCICAGGLRAIARTALAAATPPAEKEGTFERSLLRADIKAGNAEAAEAQLQRIKRLEAEAQPAEEAVVAAASVLGLSREETDELVRLVRSEGATTPPAEKEGWGSMDLLTGGTAQTAEKEGTP